MKKLFNDFDEKLAPKILKKHCFISDCVKILQSAHTPFFFRKVYDKKTSLTYQEYKLLWSLRIFRKQIKNTMIDIW